MNESRIQRLIDNKSIHEDRIMPLEVDKLKFFVICPLFPHLLRDPKACSKCKKHFCRICIEKSRIDDIRCPMCRADILSLDDPNPIVKELLESISISCVNSDKGCRSIFEISKIEIHETECEYKAIKCPNANCNVILLKKDIPEHRKICDRINELCPFCFKNVMRVQFQNHIENECKSICVFCNQEIASVFRDQHIQLCGLTQVVCNLCRCVVYLKDYKNHSQQHHNSTAQRSISQNMTRNGGSNIQYVVQSNNTGNQVYQQQTYQQPRFYLQ